MYENRTAIDQKISHIVSLLFQYLNAVSPAQRK